MLAPRWRRSAPGGPEADKRGPPAGQTDSSRLGARAGRSAGARTRVV